MSLLNVNKVDPQTGTTLELGTSGDTITVPTGAGLTVTDEVKTNKISPATGTAFTLGDSGDTFTVPSGATIVNSGTATGFGITATSFRPNVEPLIINGDMAVAQRSTSVASVTDVGYYTCDRIYYYVSGAGTVTITQGTDVPTGKGFFNSYDVDVTTADGSLDATDYATVEYRMEGQNLQLLKKGTASAEDITISFWVKATKTGTHILEIYDNDNTRHISKSFTIDTTNTWEQKIINVAGDTSGTLGNDNAYSLGLIFWLRAGSNYTSGTLASSWASVTAANRAVGQVDTFDSTSNDFIITGLQMEVGEYTSATIPPFQHESFGDNLDRCQRYFTMYAEGAQAPVGNGLFWEAAEVMVTCHLPTTMRLEPPTIYQTTGTDYYFLYRNGAADGISELTLNASSSPNAITIYLNSGTNGLASDTKNRPCILRAGSASAKFGLDAEL